MKPIIFSGFAVLTSLNVQKNPDVAFLNILVASLHNGMKQWLPASVSAPWQSEATIGDQHINMIAGGQVHNCPP